MGWAHAGIPFHARWIAAALWIDGQTPRQIADQFGVTVGQVRTAIRWVAYNLGMRPRFTGSVRKGLVSLRTAGELEKRMRRVGLLP